MGVAEDDALVAAFTTWGEGEVLLATAAGQAIRFAEEEVRVMGLSAAGVLGIKLGEGDRVVGAALVKP
jgi:DNA gyrase subunit A